jgi:hypothetical protein
MKSPSPDNRPTGPLTDYWTYFESENSFEKVLPLATMPVQVFIHQFFVNPSRANRHNFPIQIIGPRPLDRQLVLF